jgi:hypothetical protein
MTHPTPEQIRAFLDDLAALTAAHGLVLDGDASGHMSLDPIAGSVSYGGYCARIRQHESGARWWEVGVAEAGVRSDRWPVQSVDVKTLLAHQRLEIEKAVRRVREILREGEG